MRIDVLSIFPDYLAPLRLSLFGRAIETGLVDLAVHDLRGWTHDRHRTVDDTPYGGGPGMVMRPEPWGLALDELADEDSRLLVMSPSGVLFTQRMADQLAREEHLVIACGRYEGIDARVVEHARGRMRTEEVSIGDYVLNGGEAAALAVVEAVVRLVPGVIGNPESLTSESHSTGHGGLLEYPVFTKPPSWRGLDVPEVLFSGHHAAIEAWRHDQSVRRTRERRPDLLADELTIAVASDADAGELLTLQRAAYVPEGRLHRSIDIPPLTESLDELRAALGTETFLVARFGRRVVGSVRGRAEPYGSWFVGRLMVVPDRQGQGIGAALLAAIEARAPQETVRVRLTTGANSAHNLGFYGRRGYVETGRSAPDGEVALVTMEKSLR